MDLSTQTFEQRKIIFIIVLLTIEGFYAGYNAGIMPGFILSQTFPRIIYVGFWIWLLGAVSSLLCLTIGSYLLLRHGKTANHFIFTYLVLVSLEFKTNIVKFNWLPFSLSFYLQLGDVGIGINFVGLLLLVWYLRLIRSSRGVSPSLV